MPAFIGLKWHYSVRLPHRHLDEVMSFIDQELQIIRKYLCIIICHLMYLKVGKQKQPVRSLCTVYVVYVILFLGGSL